MAEDTPLKSAYELAMERQVAIKVLPALVAGDTERLARFQLEAEVLAAQGGTIENGFTTEGAMRLLPHLHGTDGFFAAVMERK